MTFDEESKPLVFEGFTKGALKNILSVSRAHKVRLYKVTHDSIDLLSYSEMQSNSVRELHKSSSFRYYSIRGLLDRHNTSIQLTGSNTKQSIILKFDYQTGALVKDYCCIPWFRDQASHLSKLGIELENPTKSLIDSYAYLSWYSMDSEGKKTENREFVKIRKGKLRRWGFVADGSSSEIQKEKEIFERQKMELRPEIRSNFYFQSKHLETHKHSEIHPHLTVMISHYHSTVVYKLVNLNTKKVLKRGSIRLLEILASHGIEELLNDELQIDPQADNPAENANIFESQIYSCIYLAKEESLIVRILFKNIEVKVKIPKVFSTALPKKYSLFKSKMMVAQWNWLMPFGGDKILWYHTDCELKDSKTRPLAWLDTENFEQTVLKGMGEHPKSAMISYMQDRMHIYHVKLSEKRLLRVNRLIALIYDFEEGELVAEQRVGLGNFDIFEKALLRSIGWVYARSYGRFLNIIRSEKTGIGEEEKEERIKHLRTIYTDEYFDNLDWEVENYKFNFFQLPTGNYLYLANKHFKAEDPAEEAALEHPIVDLCGLEIDQKSFEVVRAFRKPLDYLQQGWTLVSEISMIGNFFIMSGKFKPQILAEDEARNGVEDNYGPESNSNRLILANLDFEMVDYCKKAELRSSFPIKVVSSERVISIGEHKELYLHKIDQKTLKLVLLKMVRLKSGSIIVNKKHFINRSSLCIKVKVDGTEEPIEGINNCSLLKFDLDLNLTSYLRFEFEGIQKLYSFHSLDQANVACCFGSQRGGKKIFLANLDQRTIRLANRYQSVLAESQYWQEDGSERYFTIELQNEAINKVYLSE